MHIDNELLQTLLPSLKTPLHSPVLTLSNWLSVIVRPQCRSTRWGCSLGEAKASPGTLVVAFCRTSATSSRSLQNAEMEYNLESSTCFCMRRRTFSVSARARVYLSYRGRSHSVLCNVICQWININIVISTIYKINIIDNNQHQSFRYYKYNIY